MLCVRKDCVRSGAQYRIVESRTGEQQQVVFINEGCTDRYIPRGFLDSLADVCIYHTLKMQRAKAISLILLVSVDGMRVAPAPITLP